MFDSYPLFNHLIFSNAVYKWYRFFFFFQAEDGIRDSSVTGVQTCALPISPVYAPRRRGFGTIVMEAMAERSVDGKVDLDYAPSGLTWRLTCPAANALEPRVRKSQA